MLGVPAALSGADYENHIEALHSSQLVGKVFVELLCAESFFISPKSEREEASYAMSRNFADSLNIMAKIKNDAKTLNDVSSISFRGQMQWVEDTLPQEVHLKREERCTR